jgi:hypothetical protein
MTSAATSGRNSGASLKLVALNVEIDALTPEPRAHLSSRG